MTDNIDNADNSDKCDNVGEQPSHEAFCTIKAEDDIKDNRSNLKRRSVSKEKDSVDDLKQPKVAKLETSVNCDHQAINGRQEPSSKAPLTDIHMESHDAEKQRIKMENNALIECSSGKEYLHKYMYMERYENGGGYVLHAYQDELSKLSPADMDAFVSRYFKCLFRESRQQNGQPYSLYCLGVIHGAAHKIPELLSYLVHKHANVIVKTNVMEFKNDVQTLTMAEYGHNVFNTYKNGLFRYGPLHSVSLVGRKGEETGGYFKDVIKYLERNPFLRQVMPWGPLTRSAGMSPDASNDGPILWVRHGEQAVPCTTTKKKKVNSPGANISHTAPIMNLPTTTRGGVIRQTVVHDRTPCHADHADDGLDRHTTGAIGVLKAIHPPNMKHRSNNRVVKDVVCFDPRHYSDLIKRLKLDIMEPPASQCGNFWADDAELSLLRMEGYRYVRIWLRDNDIYFIPRNVVHQFKTVSSVASVAWHARLRRYYQTPAAPPPPPPQ